MLRYLTRRLLLFVPTLFGVSLLIFLLMRVLPGDVAYAVLAGPSGEGIVTPAALETVRQRLGLDKPLHVQYMEWVTGMARLDFGNSLRDGKPVWDKIVQRLPITVELAILTAVIGTAIAIPTGTISAVYQDSLPDYVLRIITIIGLAAPTFWIGTLVLIGLVRFFDWMPPLTYAPLWEDPQTNLQQMIWPAAGLGYHLAAVVARMTRSSMLEVMRQDYIRTAWAKGLRDRVVIIRHALRNAMLPVITIIGLQFAVLLGGTVIMETIFSVPGIGRLLVDGIRFRDYATVQAGIVMFAIIILIVNLAVDVLYGWFDPRVSYK